MSDVILNIEEYWGQIDGAGKASVNGSPHSLAGVCPVFADWVALQCSWPVLLQLEKLERIRWLLTATALHLWVFLQVVSVACISVG